MPVKKAVEKPVVLISAVNINEGGPLSILQDAVNIFIARYIKDYKLVLLIHNKELFKEIAGNPSIEIYQYAYSKRSWFLRAWFEYVHCWFISKKIDPDIWISLNDITPNVTAKKRVVYCQNPAPFYKLDKKTYSKERKLFFFRFFYTVFYRINIRSNKYVIVQQQWLQKEFMKRYKIENVVVAHPDVIRPQEFNKQKIHSGNFVFFYPALPRAFKNFEVLFQAASLVYKQHKDFEVIVTFDGSENRYASKLAEQHNTNSYLRLMGIQSRDSIWQLYNACSCLVFPSLMETWGLPISEAKLFNKPMLVADLPYAHETVGNYDKACFFYPNDAVALAALMEKAINGSLNYDVSNYTKPQQPFVQSWNELFELILDERVRYNADTKVTLSAVYDA